MGDREGRKKQSSRAFVRSPADSIKLPSRNLSRWFNRYIAWKVHLSERIAFVGWRGRSTHPRSWPGFEPGASLQKGGRSDHWAIKTIRMWRAYLVKRIIRPTIVPKLQRKQVYQLQNFFTQLHFQLYGLKGKKKKKPNLQKLPLPHTSICTELGREWINETLIAKIKCF